MQPEMLIRRDNFGMLAGVFEALVLVSSTLLLCGLYVSYGRHVPVRGWLIIFSLGIPFSLAGAIVASYKSAQIAALCAKSSLFRITPQLILTLEAEGVPKDVRLGLKELMGQNGGYPIEGEHHFEELLEERFGSARAAEVKATVFKYARVNAES